MTRSHSASSVSRMSFRSDHADVVNEGVDVAPGVGHSGHHRLNVGAVRNVAGDRERGSVVRRVDRAGDGLCPLADDVHNGDARSLVGERTGDALAYVASGPGYDDGPVLQAHGLPRSGCGSGHVRSRRLR